VVMEEVDMEEDEGVAVEPFTSIPLR